MGAEIPPIWRDGQARTFRWAMLADDLTGGCDAGVQFSRHGLPTRVYLDLSSYAEPFDGLSVLITHSRGDAPDEAAWKVQQACLWLAGHGLWLCYKKIDSTLKGNLSAELECIRRYYPDRLVLLAPAFPAMGRELADGWLRVRADPKINPVHLPSLLLSQGAQSVAHIGEETLKLGDGQLLQQMLQKEAAGGRILVIDARSRDHLCLIARIALQMFPRPVLVGSAGLAGLWSDLLMEEAQRTNALKTPVSKDSVSNSGQGPVILCVGSTNPVTQRQLQRLIETQPAETLCWQTGDVEKAAGILEAKRHLVLSVVPDRSAHLSLRRFLPRVLERCQVSGFLFSGGDTAKVVCDSLQVKAIDLKNELMTGLPWGRLIGGPANRLPVCTKAGGFGDVDALCAAVNYLASQPKS